jgi:membrane protein YqaA with SNARE-associated domain
MDKFVVWLQSAALTLGAPGLFIVAFLDSSVLPLPELNDLLLVWMATQHESRMIIYVVCAVLGSVAGSLVPYSIGRKGGEAFIRKRFSAGRVDRVTGALKRHGLVAVLVACLMPPPAPFKLFMMLSGAAGIAVERFLTAIAIGRSIRFFGLGLLAVRYGDRALALMRANSRTVSLVLIGLILTGLVGFTLWSRAQTAKDR